MHSGQGRTLWLKVIYFAKLKACQYTADGAVAELELVRQLGDPNICRYGDGGTMVMKGQQIAYIATEFVSGETVADKMARESTLSVYQAKEVCKAALRALGCLHSLPRPVAHGNVVPQNLLLDLCATPAESRLTGFSHARPTDGRPAKDGLDGCNPFYLAPERFDGRCTVESDIFAVGAMLYHTIFGLPPWFIDLSNYKEDDRMKALLARRRAPLSVPDMNIFDLDEHLVDIMAKAMAADPAARFQSATEMIRAIDGEAEVRPMPSPRTDGKKKPQKGGGFADVAGMDELKEQLRSDVIDLLRHPARAKELGLAIPNGLLFYGPPGCGKTFFAERFAEEIGCNYIYVLCSDVASPYIHGGQEKIAKIFEQARKAAPTILFLDEVDALIADRRRHNNVSEQGEVNEFLGQLNNCGQEGVMVIGATNKPKLIDPAALRAGRLELKYYIAPPDRAMRMALFRIGLRGRSVELGIDYPRLADMTGGRVAADIRLIIDTAARLTFRRGLDKIDMPTLEEAAAKTEPTVSQDEIRQCEKARDEFLNQKQGRPRIGF